MNGSIPHSPEDVKWEGMQFYSIINWFSPLARVSQYTWKYCPTVLSCVTYFSQSVSLTIFQKPIHSLPVKTGTTEIIFVQRNPRYFCYNTLQSESWYMKRHIMYNATSWGCIRGIDSRSGCFKHGARKRNPPLDRRTEEVEGRNGYRCLPDTNQAPIESKRQDGWVISGRFLSWGKVTRT